jgi:hypothetical protein
MLIKVGLGFNGLYFCKLSAFQFLIGVSISSVLHQLPVLHGATFAYFKQKLFLSATFYNSHDVFLFIKGARVAQSV